MLRDLLNRAALEIDALPDPSVEQLKLVRELRNAPDGDPLPPTSREALINDAGFDELRRWRGPCFVTDRESQAFREGYARGIVTPRDSELARRAHRAEAEVAELQATVRTQLATLSRVAQVLSERFTEAGLCPDPAGELCDAEKLERALVGAP